MPPPPCCWKRNKRKRDARRPCTAGVFLSASVPPSQREKCTCSLSGNVLTPSGWQRSSISAPCCCRLSKANRTCHLTSSCNLSALDMQILMQPLKVHRQLTSCPALSAQKRVNDIKFKIDSKNTFFYIYFSFLLNFQKFRFFCEILAF